MVGRVAVDAPELLAHAVTGAGHVPDRIADFLAERRPETPCLVMDLDVVAARFRALEQALPDARVFYAVKANPESPVLELLVGEGASFDVASPAEIDLCLIAGAAPSQLSFGNTIKKPADIRYAYEKGVRLYAVDSGAELDKIAVHAPGSAVFVRVLTTGAGADWPLSKKFGCAPGMAADLLLSAADAGLCPWGVSFHVGSQQRDPAQWDPALATAAAVFAEVADRSAGAVVLRGVNIGGGFPAHYLDPVPELEDYATAIRASFERHFPDDPSRPRPEVVVEPGRYVVGDAGVLCTEVVLVSRKDYDEEERWVYLDTGVFGGLAESIGEAIKYRFASDRDGGATGPVIIAGPTCDSLDVCYQHHRYELPLDLAPGDRLQILSAGAYTKTYCTDGFNGFAPMPAHCLPARVPVASG